LPFGVFLFLNSSILCRLLETVPEEERPPILLSIYADGIDRDQTLHSSGQHKLHCTYIKFVNLSPFGCRSRYDYELVQLLNEEAIKVYGYNTCHEIIVSKISNVVENGIMLNGRKHAVRVAYLQVNMYFLCNLLAL
jgi:hypothetical protein